MWRAIHGIASTTPTPRMPSWVRVTPMLLSMFEPIVQVSTKQSVQSSSDFTSCSLADRLHSTGARERLLLQSRSVWRHSRLLKPATAQTDQSRIQTRSLRALAFARSRVERHTQCQSLLAGCAFGSLELAGDLGGRRLLPRERFELAYLLRGPLPPFRLLDHHDLRGCSDAASADSTNRNRHLSLVSSSFYHRSHSFCRCKWTSMADFGPLNRINRGDESS